MDDVGDKGGISKSSQHKLRTPQATPLSVRYTTTSQQGRHLLNAMVDPVYAFACPFHFFLAFNNFRKKKSIPKQLNSTMAVDITF
jgi:hypothetical protein